VKALAWIIVLFAVAVGVTLFARYNTGYVLLVIPPWRIEFSLNVLLVALAVAFAAGYAVVRATSATMRLPRQVREYRLARRRERAPDLDFQERSVASHRDRPQIESRLPRDLRRPVAHGRFDRGDLVFERRLLHDHHEPVGPRSVGVEEDLVEKARAPGRQQERQEEQPAGRTESAHGMRTSGTAPPRTARP
jgi:uncharacterized membrane protein YciS (DUF1049 family)